MDALWNSLKRGTMYQFIFGDGLKDMEAEFHAICPDGTLFVKGHWHGSTINVEYTLNPAAIVAVRRLS